MYYDILKASKVKAEVFPDYWTLLWGRKLSASMIKTITGVLPLTFTAKGGTAVDWVIYGNDDVGKNLLNIYDTWKGSFATVNVENDIVTIVGSWFSYLILSVEKNTDYYINFNVVSTTSVSGVGVYGVKNGEYDNNDIVMTMRAHSSSFNSGDREQIAILFYCAYASTGTTVYSNIMLTKGSTAPDHYIPYQQGVGERTANLWNEEWELGIWNISNGQKADNLTNIRNKNKIPIESSTTYYWYNNKSDVIRFAFFDANGDYINSPIVTTKSGTVYSFTSPANAKFFCFYYGATEYENCVTLSITSPETYIPYGYQIPLTVSQDGQPNKTYDIYIGDTPLTEGQQVSKTSIGQDIELVEGENVVSTTLYNKPAMEIKYK